MTKEGMAEAIRVGMLDAHQASRRDLLAGMALQGLLANTNACGDRAEFAADAVEHADALITQLDKVKP